MKEMIKMIVVLTILSSFSGGLLAYIRDNTAEQIEMQQLQFVKGPAIKEIMQGAVNDPIADRFKITDGELERTLFVGKFDGDRKAVALETYGKGYGGDVGVMVGINVEDGTLMGVGVTTHAETPGMGARAKDEPHFVAQFKGMATDAPFKVSNDGGQINAISGATITSRAVSNAATEATEIYKRLKDQIQEQANAIQ